MNLSKVRHVVVLKCYFKNNYKNENVRDENYCGPTAYHLDQMCVRTGVKG